MVDLLDMVIPEEQEEQIKQSLEEKTKYKVRIKSRLLESGMYTTVYVISAVWVKYHVHFHLI